MGKITQQATYIIESRLPPGRTALYWRYRQYERLGILPQESFKDHALTLAYYQIRSQEL